MTRTFSSIVSTKRWTFLVRSGRPLNLADDVGLSLLHAARVRPAPTSVRAALLGTCEGGSEKKNRTQPPDPRKPAQPAAAGTGGENATKELATLRGDSPATHLHLRCVVPIQREGDTVELHAWYDAHLFPAVQGPRPEGKPGGGEPATG